jgi:hypothetical protein
VANERRKNKKKNLDEITPFLKVMWEVYTHDRSAFCIYANMCIEHRFLEVFRRI